MTPFPTRSDEAKFYRSQEALMRKASLIAGEDRTQNGIQRSITYEALAVGYARLAQTIEMNRTALDSFEETVAAHEVLFLWLEGPKRQKENP